MDDVDASLRVAEMVRKHFPDLPVYARARDRIHVHKLMDLGVGIIERETFLSALELTHRLLRGLGLSEPEAKRLLATFKRQDEKRLYDDYKYYTDVEKVRANALTATVELEQLFDRDVEELKPPEWGRLLLALSGEMVGDQPVHLGRMGERAHPRISHKAMT